MGLLDDSYDQNKLKELLKRTSLDTQFNYEQNQGARLASLQARLGHTIPFGSGNLNLGLSAVGNMYKSKEFKDKMLKLQGVDAEYAWGDNAIGGSYSPDMTNLYYRRNF